MRLALLGGGRMGKEVAAAADRRGHEVAVTLDSGSNAGGRGIAADAFAGIDAVIDFSRAEAVGDNIAATIALGIPIVVGTTGWDEHLEAVRELVRDRDGALVYGSNFSVGAHLFFRLVEHAARLFEPFDDYDPYVFEHHHRRKADAPSGTALRLADLITNASSRKSTVQAGNARGPLEPTALHVASIRAGYAFGEHRVGFDGPTDVVQLVHTARGRRGFAEGALLAAEWIQGKRGVFEFAEVLDELAGGTSEHRGTRERR